jgi:hypothetical protein
MLRELEISPAQVLADLPEPFSGRMVFHQKNGNVIYHVTIKDGIVSGYQSHEGSDKPTAYLVGGWYDVQHGKLSVLIQGTKALSRVWRVQAQQF